MTKTMLSSKGQVIIPKPVRSAHHWGEGQELFVIDCADGVILKPVVPFNQTTLREVGACLKYEGQAKSLKEMDKAIQKGVKDRHYDIR